MFDSLDVECGATTLMNQAHMTASTYLEAAVDKIDGVFGDGHAKKHPELVAAFLATSAADYHSGMMKAGAQDVRDALSKIADSISEAAQAIRDLEIAQ